MKTIITLLFSLFGFSVIAQMNSIVTITVLNNKNSEIMVDSKTYMVTRAANTSTSVNEAIVISDLLPGKHTLQMVKVNANNSRKNMSNANFTTRSDYDLAITVNTSGSLQLRESKNSLRVTHKPPMSDVNFSILLKDIQRQWIPGAKMTASSNAFSNPNNYFTTAQARQLIKLVNDEGNRVLLAKTAYRTLVDPANFTQLYDLFENQPSKDDLTAFVNNYNNKGIPNTTQKVAMSDGRFNDLLQSVQRQWIPGGKMTSATNAFSNTSHYFTVAQARQLITVVNDETNRLQLAKLSYRTIVDVNNFSDIYNLFTNQANRDNLASYVNTFNDNSKNTATSSSGQKAAMSDANFSAILKDAQGQWMPNGKMTAATNAFQNKNNYFTTAQVRQLIILVDDETNRLKLAELSYRSVVDPNNFTQVYELLSTQQNKNDLSAFISSYNATNGINNTTNNNGTNLGKAPMPDDQFVVLIDNIKRQWIPGSRMTIVTNAFANHDNYFTTYQARQILQYINDEANKLTLAKAAYRTIVDPANFSQLYDLFTTQKNKDELAAYVRTYKP